MPTGNQIPIRPVSDTFMIQSMKYMMYVIIFVCLYGCSDFKNSTGYKPTPESIEREKLANKITAQVAAKLKKDRGLSPIGFGGRTSNGVQMLALSFLHYQPITIENGRELLVTCVQEFTKAVNQEKPIRPYLKNFPFTSKNVEIRIFLQNIDGSQRTTGLNVISALEGILNYDIRNPDGPLFITLLEETYDEAVQKLNADNHPSIHPFSP
jgi:hypothetical protein